MIDVLYAGGAVTVVAAGVWIAKRYPRAGLWIELAGLWGFTVAVFTAGHLAAGAFAAAVSLVVAASVGHELGSSQARAQVEAHRQVLDAHRDLAHTIRDLVDHYRGTALAAEILAAYDAYSHHLTGSSRRGGETR